MSRKTLLLTAGLLALTFGASANAADYWRSNGNYDQRFQSNGYNHSNFGNSRFNDNRWNNNWNDHNNWNDRNRFDNRFNYNSNYYNSWPSTTYRSPVVSTWTTPLQTYYPSTYVSPYTTVSPYTSTYTYPGILPLNCR